MRKKAIILTAFLLFLLISGVIGLSMERNLVIAVDSELSNQCAYIINDAVEYALAENAEIADLPVVEKTAEGMISYVSVNSMTLNRFSMDVMKILEDEVRGLKNLKIPIPIGNLLFSKMLSGKGPMISFEAYPVGGIDIAFDPVLEDAGINQVLFHMDLKVTTEIVSMVGFREHHKDITRTVPVCDIIIVGKVPETYANLPAETDFLNLLP